VLGLVAGVEYRRQQILSEGRARDRSCGSRRDLEWLRGTYSGNFYRGDWRAHLPCRRDVGVAALEPATRSRRRADPAGAQAASFSENSFALPVLNQREFPLRATAAAKRSSAGNRASS